MKNGFSPISRRTFLGALIIGALSVSSTLAQAGSAHEIGVMLLHDAWSGPEQLTSPLSDTLKKAGYQVSALRLPWSQNRAFDKTFEDALWEIDFSIGVMQANGANHIALVGFGLGANAALAYGASHPGLLGIAAISPAHTPERPDIRQRFAGRLEDAASRVRSGVGRAPFSYTDLVDGKLKTITVTASIFTSFYNPNGRANMPMSAARQQAPTLIIEGEEDDLASMGQDYLFSHLPTNHLNRFVMVPGKHADAPLSGREEILRWLKEVSTAQDQAH